MVDSVHVNSPWRYTTNFIAILKLLHDIMKVTDFMHHLAMRSYFPIHCMHHITWLASVKFAGPCWKF